MCLVRSNIHCGSKYATEDIICYKVLRKNNQNEYFSPYAHFIYELNKRVSSIFSFTLSTSTSFPPQKEYTILKSLTNFNCVTQGLHSFNCLPAAIEFRDCFVKEGIVMECIIPKESWYYEGINNELVSNNIIINREI